MCDFTFVVISYNHEMYIIEHLESIAFQIKNYGSDRSFQLIVADDGSSDQTLNLVRYWLSFNSSLFCDVEVCSQEINEGTCRNFTKVWHLIKGGLCKFTAGDDVYSCEDLFKDWEEVRNGDIVSGMPLWLIGGALSWPRIFNFNMIATLHIYTKGEFIRRLMGVGFLHTPSIIFNRRYFYDEALKKFINSFYVTEDFPMQVKISEGVPNLRFVQCRRVHIYYRRTPQSTYIIRNTSFDRDKLRIFQYLLGRASGRWQKFLLRNRIFCYRLESRLLKWTLNINYLIYGFRVFLKIVPISIDYLKFDVDVDGHQAYYNAIVHEAQRYREGFCEFRKQSAEWGCGNG